MFTMDDTGSPVTARSDATAGPEMCFSPPRQTVSYPKSKIKILLLEGVSDEAVNILKQEGFNVEAHRGKLPDDELAEKIRDAHCVGIRSGTKLTKELLALGQRLLLHRFRASGPPVCPVAWRARVQFAFLQHS
jgi:hypothetical protein